MDRCRAGRNRRGTARGIEARVCLTRANPQDFDKLIGELRPRIPTPSTALRASPVSPQYGETRAGTDWLEFGLGFAVLDGFVEELFHLARGFFR